jgi:hypothetical protein
MTVSVEELLMLLFVLHTGKPLLAKMNRRVLKAISTSPKRELRNRGNGVRLRARIIDFWID